MTTPTEDADDARGLAAALRLVTIRGWRLHLKTPGVMATVPMLRGVWGAALRGLSMAAYESIFEGGPAKHPRYWLRPAAEEVQPAPAVEWCLIGPMPAEHEAAAWDAWESAGRAGLGRDRRPFAIAEAVPLAWDETPLRPSRVQPGFSLDRLPWPKVEPESPCRLDFPAPLRLIRAGRLIESPTPADLALAALRRLNDLAGQDAESTWAARGRWLERARRVRSLPWKGRRLDLVRYSGSQRAEVDLHGVAGSLDLPDGPGPLAPLLAAAVWLHLGKGTVMGLGRLRVLGLDQDSSGVVKSQP